MEGRKANRSDKINKYTFEIVVFGKTFYIQINIAFFIVLAVMLFTGNLANFSVAYASMVLHELGHITPALLSGRRIFMVRILPIGLNVSIDEDSFSRWNSILIYFCGPFINLLLAIAGYIVNSCFSTQSGNLLFFTQLNVFLAFFNIIPVLPLDGGKILRKILVANTGLFFANSLSIKISFFISTILIALGVMQFITDFQNFSLLAIGLYLFYSLKSESVEAALMNMKEIIYRRSRLKKKGIYPARGLVVTESMHIGEALKFMDFDRFHLIHVLDDDLKLAGIYTEQQIMDSILKYNTGMTFGELLKIEIQKP